MDESKLEIQQGMVEARGATSINDVEDDIGHDMMERELTDLLPPAEEVGKHGFRFSEFRKFLGPAWLVSIAYLDPGNLETDLQVRSVADLISPWTFHMQAANPWRKIRNCACVRVYGFLFFAVFC
jgi:hypothetical protein